MCCKVYNNATECDTYPLSCKQPWCYAASLPLETFSSSSVWLAEMQFIVDTLRWTSRRAK